MPSPVRLAKHGEPQLDLMTWLGTYRAATPFVRGGDNATLQLDLDNELQPDGMLFIDPTRSGRVRFTDDGYVTGSPEFVAEISAATLAVDRGPKLRTLLRHEIREYLIWRVEDGVFEWNILRGSDYVLLQPGSDGILRSEVFPGLWLDSEAMLGGDLKRVIDTLQHGLRSPEHAQFVAQ